MREFALTIGKKNFFTYGEVYDEEDKIAHFIGRTCRPTTPIWWASTRHWIFRCSSACRQSPKASLPPSELIGVFKRRKAVERGVLSSHGEATRFFVTFLDNHDQHERILLQRPDADPHRFADQATLD